MDDKWYDDSREKSRSYRNSCISSMEKEMMNIWTLYNLKSQKAR